MGVGVAVGISRGQLRWDDENAEHIHQIGAGESEALVQVWGEGADPFDSTNELTVEVTVAPPSEDQWQALDSAVVITGAGVTRVDGLLGYTALRVTVSGTDSGKTDRVNIVVSSSRGFS